MHKLFAIGNRFHLAEIVFCLVFCTMPATAQNWVDLLAESERLEGGWRMLKLEKSEVVDSAGQLIVESNELYQRAAITDGVVRFTACGRDSIYVLSRKLPESRWLTPTLLFAECSAIITAFLDGEQLKNQTMVERDRDLSVVPYLWQWIRLPADYGDKTLILVIDSQVFQQLNIGTFAYLAHHQAALQLMFDNSLDDLVMGAFFFFIGLFSMIVYWRRRKYKLYGALSFSLFNLSMGLIVFFPHTQIFMEVNKTTYFLAFLGFYTFPIGMFAFYEQILEGPYKTIVKRLWQAHLILAAVLLFLDLSNLLAANLVLDIFFVVLLFDVVISVFAGVRAAKAGNREVQIINAGFFVLFAAGAYETFSEIFSLPHPVNVFNLSVFFFTVLMAIILERRFEQITSRLRESSRELEATSEQLVRNNEKLEEYSQTLESRVEEKIRHLREKNDELTTTLHQLQETQKQLVLREKMASMGTLAAGVAHEVNTPIGALNSAADVMDRGLRNIRQILSGEDDQRKSESITRYLQFLRTNNDVLIAAGSRITSIVRNLKSFARLDEAEYQKADLHQGIDDTLALVEYQLKDRVTVIKKFGEMPPIYCYPNRLNQVFMNLLLNAAQAIPGKGEITIFTDFTDGVATIRFADTGTGIPDGNITRIFEPGFTTRSVGSGMGFGLSVARKIIADHHGELQVESQVGEGSTFTIRIPQGSEKPRG